jgi:hypothetical protein
MYPPTVTSVLRTLLATAVLTTLLAFPGCGPRQPTAAAVDPDEARRTLEAVLSDWKEGGSPEAWQQRTPQVVVQDFDWAAGAKLKSFELLGPGDIRDANLICKVKIVAVQAPKGEVQRTVTYVVGTDPVLTVFRDSLQ